MAIHVAGEGNDLELQVQDHEEWRKTPIDFKFPGGLTNSATMFLTVVGMLGSLLGARLDVGLFVDLYASSSLTVWVIS
jgi:hypothetical protein